MKKNNSITFLLVVLFACSIFYVKAQAPHFLQCGNARVDTAAQSLAMRYENTHRPETVNYLVRVWFHVLCNTDGTQRAITNAQLASEFTQLLGSYAGDNVCFLNAGYDTIKSTTLNNNYNGSVDTTGIAVSSYMVPGCMNVFYMTNIVGNNGASGGGIGGLAIGGIPGTAYLVGSGNIGPANSVSHEMGHSLGLLHTFDAYYYGYERIDGSNSSTAGDRIPDTPADPYVYKANSCFSTNAAGCLYTGSCTDPAGASNFSPPYTNLMAYWRNAGACYVNTTFTNGQFTRISSFLSSSQALINCSSPSTVTISPITVSSTYYMKSAINTLLTTGAVNFTGTAVVTLGGGNVLLEPGFLASPTTGGLTHVVLKPCN